MSYSRRQLYAMGEPIGASATHRKADGGLIFGGGGGGGGSGNATSTNTNMTELPEWARGYAKDALYQAGKLTDINKNPYQTYDQNRIAGFTPMQEQAQQGAANMQPNAALGTGTDMATAAGMGALGTNYQAGQYGNQFQAPQNLGYNANTFQANQMGPVRDVSATGYDAPTMNAAQTGYNPRLKNYQMGPAERVNTQSFAQPGSADAYMSPYMQNVVETQKREAGRQSAIQGTQQQAQAAQAGAFGGGRDAIMRAERERNLGTQMNDIQAQGSQAAYQQAQQQFNAEQQARLVAQQANQQAGITTGSQNLAAKLGVQQLGTQTGMQTTLANLSNAQQQQVQNQAAQLQTQGMNAQQAMQAALANQQRDISVGGQNLSAMQQTDLANQSAQNQAAQYGAGQGLQAAGLGAQYGQGANQLNEQSRQYGAGLGLQGLQTGLQAAGQMGQLGQAQYGQEMGINQLQNQYGGQQQALAQQGLSQGYQDFLNQQNYPYKQLGFMSDMIRGLPLGQQSTAQMYQAPPSMMQNVAAAGMGAYGLSKLVGKEGGLMKGYASGGVLNRMDDPNRMAAAVDKLTDEQLKSIIQNPSSEAEKEAAQTELATRRSEKQGLASAYNALPAGAGGGIVAFGKGGIMHFLEGGKTNPYDVEDAEAGAAAQVAEDADDEVESGGVGDTALHRRAVEKGLGAIDAISALRPPTAVSINDPKLGAKSYMDTMRGLAGPDPYADATAQVSDIAEKSKAALEQGKGIAALSAMGAILQGPNFMRALGGAGAAFADSYKGALAASQVAATEAAKMKINIATGKRAETLGLAKDAINSFQSARANEAAMYRAQSEALRNTATAASRLANATKAPRPAAAVRPSAQAEGVAIYAKSLMAKDPTLTQDDANAIALEKYNQQKAAGLPGVQAAVAGRTEVAGTAQDLEAQKLQALIVDKATKHVDDNLLLRDPKYREALSKKDAVAQQARRDELIAKEVKKATSTAPAAKPATVPTTRLRFDAQGVPIN